MSAIFRSIGDSLPYTPEADTPAGTVVILSALVGVTRRFIQANTQGELHVGPAVYECTAAQIGETEFTDGVGEIAYWDDTEKKVTATALDNTLVGYIVELNDENTTVKVLFTNGIPTPA